MPVPNGAPAGDAYVQVHVRPHPVLVRDGDDVVAPVRLTIAQAALGATLDRPDARGRDRGRVPRPARSRARCTCFAAAACPSCSGFRRGDQRLLVDVVVPRRLDDEQRRLLEQLDVALGEDAYRHDDDEGFFERLKSAFR